MFGGGGGGAGLDATKLVHLEKRDKRFKIQNGWAVTALCADADKDAKVLYTGHDNGCVVSWDLSMAKPKDTLMKAGGGGGTSSFEDRGVSQDMCWVCHPKSVTGICYFHQNAHLGTSSMDCTVKVWDACTGELLHQLGQKFTTKWERGFSKLKKMSMFGAKGLAKLAMGGAGAAPDVDSEHQAQLEAQRLSGKAARKATGSKVALKKSMATRKSSLAATSDIAGAMSTAPGSPAGSPKSGLPTL